MANDNETETELFFHDGSTGRGRESLLAAIELDIRRRRDEDRKKGLERSRSDYAAFFPGFSSEFEEAWLRTERDLPDPASLVEAAAIADPKRAGAEFRVGRYELRRLLGDAGLGRAYLAWDTGREREVVLKAVLLRCAGDPDGMARIQREVRTIAGLDHDGICAAEEIIEQSGRHWLVMPLVEGTSLREILRRARKQSQLDLTPHPELPIAELLAASFSDDAASWKPDSTTVELSSRAGFKAIARLVRKLADSVRVAHEVSVTHGDMRPEYVIVRNDGPPVILGFGLSEERRTDPRSRELGLVGVSGDVRGLGAVLYELLTFKSPFDTADSTTAAAVGAPRSPRRENSRLPPDLEAICMKALASSGGYEGVEALADDLGRFIDGQTVLARPHSFVDDLVQAARRRPLAAAFALLAVGVLIGLGLALALGR